MDDNNDTPSGGRWKDIATVLVAVLVVASGAVGATAGTVGAAADQQSAPSAELQEDDDGIANETLDAADEVYVRQNGDAVLVYDESNDDSDITNAEYGLHVGQGILYGLVETNLTGQDTGVTGSGSAVLAPGELTANGSLTAPQPETINSMSLSVDGVRNDQNSRFDASADASINTELAPELRLAQSADVNLASTVTASEFDASGDFSATSSVPVQEQPVSAEFTLTEDDTGYTIEAAQNQTISEFERQRWNTSERAQQTLRALYGGTAQQIGGQATVTVESHSFTETDQQGLYRLDVEYTVEYEGIDQGIEQLAAAGLAQSEDLDLSRAEASAVAQNVTELELERVSGSFSAESFSQGSQTVQGEFDIQLNNYDQALLAGLDTLEAYEPEDTAGGAQANISDAQIQTIRDQLEAQREADLVRTYELNLSLSQPSRTEAQFSMSAQSRTENWAAYVQELSERGIDRGNLEYSLQAESDGGNINANGSFTFTKDQLVDDVSDQLINVTEQQEMDADAEQTRQVLEAFQQAGFEKARTDVEVTQNDVTFQVGTKFEDLAAFRDVLEQSDQLDISVSEVVGRTSDDGATTQTYVYVNGAVEAGAGEEEIRALSVVNSSTTVNMPGTYDRSFPAVDTDRAFNYLELEPPEMDTPTPTPTPTPADGEDGGDGEDGDDGGDGEDGDDGGDGEDGGDGNVSDGGDGADTETGGQPGFGAVVSVIALLAAALLARRRD